MPGPRAAGGSSNDSDPSNIGDPGNSTVPTHCPRAGRGRLRLPPFTGRKLRHRRLRTLYFALPVVELGFEPSLSTPPPWPGEAAVLRHLPEGGVTGPLGQQCHLIY